METKVYRGKINMESLLVLLLFATALVGLPLLSISYKTNLKLFVVAGFAFIFGIVLYMGYLFISRNATESLVISGNEIRAYVGYGPKLAANTFIPTSLGTVNTGKGAVIARVPTNATFTRDNIKLVEVVNLDKSQLSAEDSAKSLAIRAGPVLHFTFKKGLSHADSAMNANLNELYISIKNPADALKNFK